MDLMFILIKAVMLLEGILHLVACDYLSLKLDKKGLVCCVML